MVESYLEHSGVLLLEEDLRSVDQNSDARLLARARTIAVLNGVSKDRKVRVLEFLSATKLIQFGPQGESLVVSLRLAESTRHPPGETQDLEQYQHGQRQHGLRQAG